MRDDIASDAACAIVTMAGWRGGRNGGMLMGIKPALIGKAGELLVAAELMRRGIEVAMPANDVGVDLLAYRLGDGHAVPTKLVPIQVKAFSQSGYVFHRRWFERAPGVVLVSVWHVATTPEFYVFDSIQRVEAALGKSANTESWTKKGVWSARLPGNPASALMQRHREKWCRITSQL